MNQNQSENLIFEIVNELFNNNPELDINSLYNSISNVVVNYQITKLQNHQSYDNLNHYIDLYISVKRMDGLSESTLKGYKIELGLLAKNIKTNVEDITTAHIRNFLSQYTAIKTSTMATKVSNIKSFFGWLFQEEIISKDPTRKIKTPKFNKHNPKYLDVDELEMLRESCETLRERALVETFYSSGCRLSEIYNMNIKDINFNDFSTKVIGKGNKERDVFFSLKAIHHLKRYLASRKDDCDALFVTERLPHRRLSRKAIQDEITDIAKRSPIKKHVTVHSLRHTFTTLMLSNGGELSVVQSILGHSDPATTQLYYNLTDEHKRDQYKKYLVL